MKECNMIGYVNKIETMGLVDGPGVRTVVFLQGCPLRCLFCHNPETWQVNTCEVYTPLELATKIIRNKNYFGSEGGVTFSGGEPLLQTDFLIEVCKLLKKENINICLDTSGNGTNNYEILDYIDLVILDIKGIDDESYKKMWLRQVIVPSINDTEEYILKLKKFIKNIYNVEKVELLPYHTMGITKYDELNIDYPLKNIPAMDKEGCLRLEELLKK